MRGVPFKIHSAIFLAISFLGILLITIGVVIPSVKRILSLQKQITDTQTLFEKQYREATLVRRSIREAPEISERLEMYGTATTKVTDALDLVTLFEKIATEKGVEQNIDVSCTDQKPVRGKGQKPDPVGLPSCTFTFLNHGTLEEHMAFLGALERLPQFLFIDSTTWAKRKGGSPTDLTLGFAARVYVK